MSSIDRPLSGKPLLLHLDEARRAEHIDGRLLEKSGRSARTLVKDGPLRVTLVALGTGGMLAEHQADGPITVHVISGSVLFRVADESWTLEAGDLLSLGAAVPHAVESAEGGMFVLTVATGDSL